MKKAISLLLVIGLIFIITGCSNVGLSDIDGFGYIMVAKAYLEDNSEVTTGTVSVDGNEAAFGESILLKTGTYKVTITDEAGNVTAVEGVVVTSGETTVISDAVLQAPSTNAWKFIFRPTNYGVTVTDEVHLVGDLPGVTWDPANKSYPLLEQDDGTWVGIFDIPEGTEFKFIYDSTSWNGHDIGDNGSNYVVGNYPNVVEPVLAWKFIFRPTNYGVTVTDEVHLVGDLPDVTWDPANKSYLLVEHDDGTWVGYYDISEGTEFKFIYDSTSWNGHDIGDNGSNYVVGNYPDVVTQNF